MAAGGGGRDDEDLAVWSFRDVCVLGKTIMGCGVQGRRLGLGFRF